MGKGGQSEQQTKRGRSGNCEWVSECSFARISKSLLREMNSCASYLHSTYTTIRFDSIASTGSFIFHISPGRSAFTPEQYRTSKKNSTLTCVIMRLPPMLLRLALLLQRRLLHFEIRFAETRISSFQARNRFSPF